MSTNNPVMIKLTTLLDFFKIRNLEIKADNRNMPTNSNNS